MENQELYEEAIERYGKDAQINVAIEEMAELTNAIMKWKRGRAHVYDVIDEIADVSIMMEQLSLIFDEHDLSLVQTRRKMKALRLKTRLILDK